MRYKFDKNTHSVYSLYYHFVQCVKYRRKVLCVTSIVNELKMRTINISKKYGIDIISQETDLDHIHILFKTKPQTNLIKFINNWKSSTSKVLRNRFGDILNKKLWKNILWSKSYCLLTTGQVSLEQIKQYVEGQGQ